MADDNTQLPKPGERWCSKSNGPDVIIDPIDRNKFAVRQIGQPFSDYSRKSDPSFSREHIAAGPHVINLDLFVEIYEKLKTESRDLIVSQFSTGTELFEIAFEPESSRLSRLSVKIKNSRFPICTMEFNEIEPMDPVEFLIGLNRDHVRDALFGLQAESPDFLATMAYVNDLKLGDFIYNDLMKVVKEFDGCHERACEELVDLLRNQKLPDFNPESIIQTRENSTVTMFMEEVWASMRFFLETNIKTNMFSQFAPDRNDEKVASDRNDDNTPEPG